MRTGGTALAILATGSVVAAGCSTVLGVDADRFVADAGGNSKPGPLTKDPPSWGCLDRLPQDIDLDARVPVTLTVIDPIQNSESQRVIDGGSDLVTVSGVWIPNVTVTPCSLLDTTCGEAHMYALTDDGGKASFVLPGNFHGYFTLSNPGLVPGMLYPGHLLVGHGTDELPAFGLMPSELEDVAVATSTKKILDADAGVGVAVVTIYDCEDHQASEISVKFSHLSPDSLPFYFNGGLPDPGATETDEFGLAGAINVPSGTQTVTARRTSDQFVVGSATFDVRPGVISSVFIRVRTQ